MELQKNYQASEAMINKYLADHGLTPQLIREYRLTVDYQREQIEIPICDTDGKYIFSKYRVFGVKGMKYRYTKGSSMALYNGNLIDDHIKKVFIVEGEFDAIAGNEYLRYDNFTLDNFSRDELNSNILFVSSTGGCKSWNPEWNDLLKGKEVVILYDSDKAGVEGSVMLFEKLLGVASGITIATLDGAKDICDLAKQYNYSSDYFYKMRSHIIEVFNLSSEEVPLENYTKKEKVNMLASIINSINESELFAITTINREYFNLLRALFRRHYEQLTRKSDTKTTEKVTGDDIESLKKTPITNYVNFHYGLAKCIFHHDHSPSMRYNDFNNTFPNTVKCYSCGKFADVIDVVKELNNTDFKGALEILRRDNRL